MKWPSAELGEVAVLDRDSVHPSDASPDTPYIGLEHVDGDGGIEWSETVESAELKSNKFRFTNDHVLFGKLRPYLRKIARPEASGICSTDIIPLMPGEQLDRDYLFHFLRTPAMVDLATSRCSGANLPRLSPKHLAGFVVPLPPLAEQKRIAGILDAADALRAKRRESLAQLDMLIQATFLDIVGDIGRPPISIGVPRYGRTDSFVPISSVARLATGHTPDRNIAEYWGGEIPWIGLTDIRDLDGQVAVETGQTVTQAGIDNSSSVVLPKNTVCFSRTASVGFSTVMGREMATSQDFVNWVCGDDLNPLYLMTALRVSRPYLLSKSSGSTHKTIYYRQAEQFKVHLPPVAMQRRFADVLRTAFAQRTSKHQHLDELGALFSSLQSRAFAGEL